MDNIKEIDGSIVEFKWIDNHTTTAQGQMKAYRLKFFMGVACGLLTGLLFSVSFGFLFAPPAILLCSSTVLRQFAMINKSIRNMRLPIFFALWSACWIICIIYFGGFPPNFNETYWTVFIKNSLIAPVSAIPPVCLYIFLRQGYRAYKHMNSFEFYLVSKENTLSNGIQDRIDKGSYLPYQDRIGD